MSKENINPRISMRESKAFSDMEAKLKEKARLAKNKAARELYAARKQARI